MKLKSRTVRYLVNGITVLILILEFILIVIGSIFECGQLVIAMIVMMYVTWDTFWNCIREDDRYPYY